MIGLFTRRMAREAGFSDGQIRHRLASGQWIIVLGPVLAQAGLQITPTVRDWAAALGIRGCVLSGPSAARTWGIDVPDKRTWVTVAAHRRIRVQGVEVRRERLLVTDVAPFEIGRRTTLGRTVFDCLRVLPDGAAESLLCRALARGWTTREEFVRRVGLHTGKHGVARLVALTRLLPGQTDPAEREAPTAPSPHHAYREGCFRCHT